MGRGKNKDNSEPAYSEGKNTVIDNKVYMTKQRVLTEEMREEKARNDGSKVKEEAYNKHSINFYTKYFKNTSNKVKLTRIASTVKGAQAVEKFRTLVKGYETDNNILLSEISKEELMYRLLDYIEDTGTVLELADDARQFLTYRFKCPSVLKLYLYKAFYPRIFDYTVKEDNTLYFHSEYIRQNFDSIYRQIEELAGILTYDAVISAVSDACADVFNSMKRSCKITVLPEDNFEDFKYYVTNQINAAENNDSRWSILNYFIPSIFFFSKHYAYVYRDRDVEEKKVITLLTSDTFYKGNRADESRMGILAVNDECAAAIEKEKNFTRLLNLHYINKRSHMIDLTIMENNREFAPYIISGVLTKQHINDMITENAEALNAQNNGSGLKLTSVYNNPNCIAKNLNSRDYEIIDFIITRASFSIRSYYLDESVAPTKLCEFLQWLNTEANSDILGNKKIPLKINDITKSHYDEVMEFELKGL